jgi:hypothetical protein
MNDGEGPHTLPLSVRSDTPAERQQVTDHRRYGVCPCLSYHYLMAKVVLSVAIINANGDPNAFLSEYLPLARSQFLEYRNRTGPHGVGQAYSDVLIMTLIEDICTDLGIDMGTTRQTVITSYGRPAIRLSNTVVFSWLGLSPNTAVRMRNTNNSANTKYLELLEVLANTGRLTVEQHHQMTMLEILVNVDLTKPLLPPPRFAKCPPLSIAEWKVARMKRPDLAALIV